ncbi:hypothetical protein CEXT_8701 [Caerostris extrusa]|uniref:Uncharacterized protein n=1 Tax=Caerostris extrusa TaxID=172846 RepID=A0AAV4PDZ6_CAEEX|nr:hypothetical protein CEXT_8701 [Caerostris extrusa]
MWSYLRNPSPIFNATNPENLSSPLPTLVKSLLVEALQITFILCEDQLPFCDKSLGHLQGNQTPPPSSTTSYEQYLTWLSKFPSSSFIISGERGAAPSIHGSAPIQTAPLLVLRPEIKRLTCRAVIKMCLAPEFPRNHQRVANLSTRFLKLLLQSFCNW